MQINAIIPKEYLDILTEKLISLGLKIYNIRQKYINLINLHLDAIYYRINGYKGLNIKYISNFENKTQEELISAFNKLLTKDINYGKTNFGVHLDDYIFNYNDINVKNFFSEGEQKSAIIAFKLAEVKYCKEILKEKPILILDDLFSELDNTKINRILKILYKDIQTIITTTNINSLSKKIVSESKIIKVNNYKVKGELT